MESIRAFIALQLPEQVTHQLELFQNKIKIGAPRGLRWVKPENIHLTLSFLGDTPRTKISQLKDLLSEVSAKHSELHASFTQLGAFPNPNRMRVFWLGMAASPELTTLARDVNQACKACDLPGDDKPFVPHLTLARLPDGLSTKEHEQAAQLLKYPLQIDQKEFLIKNLVIYQSDLKPSGAVYTPVHLFQLSCKKEVKTEYS